MTEKVTYRLYEDEILKILKDNKDISFNTNKEQKRQWTNDARIETGTLAEDTYSGILNINSLNHIIKEDMTKVKYTTEEYKKLNWNEKKKLDIDVYQHKDLKVSLKTTIFADGTLNIPEKQYHRTKADIYVLMKADVPEDIKTIQELKDFIKENGYIDFCILGACTKETFEKHKEYEINAYKPYYKISQEYLMCGQSYIDFLKKYYKSNQIF